MEKETRDLVIVNLKELVKKGKKDVKFRAILALTLLDEGRDFAIPLLIEMLTEGDNRASEQAKIALIDVGERAVPEVLKLIDSQADDEHAQISAIVILMEILMKADERAKMEKVRKEEQDLIAKYKAEAMLRNDKKE